MMNLYAVVAKLIVRSPAMRWLGRWWPLLLGIEIAIIGLIVITLSDLH